MGDQPSKISVVQAYPYAYLQPSVAETARSAADRIRAKLKRTLADVLDIGSDLIAVKQAMPHGTFCEWLKAEFDWREWTAQGFMNVARRFADKSAIIADLDIPPSAACRLAAPSAPDEALEKAIERAQAGERITTLVADEIIASLRKKAQAQRLKPLECKELSDRLAKTLERFRYRWKSTELSELALQLRAFANELTKDGRRRHGDRGDGQRLH